MFVTKKVGATPHYSLLNLHEYQLVLAYCLTDQWSAMLFTFMFLNNAEAKLNRESERHAGGMRDNTYKVVTTVLPHQNLNT